MDILNQTQGVMAYELKGVLDEFLVKAASENPILEKQTT